MFEIETIYMIFANQILTHYIQGLSKFAFTIEIIIIKVIVTSIYESFIKSIDKL